MNVAMKQDVFAYIAEGPVTIVGYGQFSGERSAVCRIILVL
jgi:hypothetical protein